jgi:dienelactone hydrolase
MYRAVELLATHPRIDPSRIALMGFSQGGRVVLWASYPRFHRRWMKSDRPRFAAYVAFYPGCKWYTLTGDEEVSDRPIRIFQGAADDWWPAAACRDYVARMKRVGKDIAITEYPDAHHSFDNPTLPAYQRLEQAVNPGRCAWVEQPDGRFIDPDTGQPPRGPGAPCMSRGATIGYNARAHRQAIGDVKAFLYKTFTMDR